MRLVLAGLFLVVVAPLSPAAVDDLSVSDMQRESSPPQRPGFPGLRVQDHREQPRRGAGRHCRYRKQPFRVHRDSAGYRGGGDIPAQSSVTSINTFTFRQNRQRLFDPADLEWRFDAQPTSENHPPEITSNPPLSASVGEPYTYPVIAEDQDTGDVLTYTLDLAPDGMSVHSESGLLEWLPGNSGPADVIVRVTDQAGLSDLQAFFLLVNLGEADQPPVIDPIANQVVAAGTTLATMATATDPEGETVRYGLHDSPGGFAINPANGDMQWTPVLNQLGRHPVTVSAYDPGGNMAVRSFEIEVVAEAANQAPALDPVANLQVYPLEVIDLQFTARDDDPNEVLVFHLNPLPRGAQFDSTTGSLRWIPGLDNIGLIDTRVTVIDSAGARDNASFEIAVLAPQVAPVALDDAYAVAKRDLLDIPAEGVLTNDSGGDLDAVQQSDVALGTLNSFGSDGSFLYTPPPIPPVAGQLVESCQWGRGRHVG